MQGQLFACAVFLAFVSSAQASVNCTSCGLLPCTSENQAAVKVCNGELDIACFDAEYKTEVTDTTSQTVVYRGCMSEIMGLLPERENDLPAADVFNTLSLSARGCMFVDVTIPTSKAPGDTRVDVCVCDGHECNKAKSTCRQQCPYSGGAASTAAMGLATLATAVVAKMIA